MKFFFSALFISTLCFLTSANFAFENVIPNIEIDWSVNYDVDFRMIIFGFKGFLEGFNRGLYNAQTYSLPLNCFGLSDTELNADLMFMSHFINGKRPPSDVLRFTTTAVKVMTEQTHNCGYTNAIKEL